MEEKRELRRQPDNQHFGSLLMLAVTVGAFLPITWVATKYSFSFFKKLGSSDPLKADWQRHVLASSGYLELGMFDEAAQVLEEIGPEEKPRNEVLGARVNLYIVAKKWDMAAAVASHLVKVDPETAGWWISLACALRRTKVLRRQRSFCCGAQAIHSKNAVSDPACHGRRGRQR